MVRGAVSSRVDPPVFASPGPPGGLFFCRYQTVIRMSVLSVDSRMTYP